MSLLDRLPTPLASLLTTRDYRGDSELRDHVTWRSRTIGLYGLWGMERELGVPPTLHAHGPDLSINLRLPHPPLDAGWCDPDSGEPFIEPAKWTPSLQVWSRSRSRYLWPPWEERRRLVALERRDRYRSSFGDQPPSVDDTEHA